MEREIDDLCVLYCTVLSWEVTSHQNMWTVCLSVKRNDFVKTTTQEMS
jgi:hypothetical protein